MVCLESRQRGNCVNGFKLLSGLTVILISVFAIISISEIFYTLIPIGLMGGFCGLRSLIDSMKTINCIKVI